MKLRIAIACMIVFLSVAPAAWSAGPRPSPGAADGRAGSAWYVDDDAPGDPGPGNPLVSDPLEDGSPDHPFDAIQEAVDAAASGGLVLVEDGTYSGQGNWWVHFDGKPLTVRSVNGPEASVIDGGSTGQGFRFAEGDGPDAVVEGLTIINGHASEGGAIYCGSNSSPTIVGNVLADCHAGKNGGAIYCGWESSPTIKDNLISGNEADELGGGIFATRATVLILDNEIRENWSLMRGGGIMSWNTSSLTLAGNTISGNESVVGAGLHLDDSSGVLFNNLITGNTASGGGGGIFCREWNLSVTNCTVTGNSAFNGGAIACQNAAVEVSNSILWNNAPNEIHILTGAPPSIDHSDVQGGWAGPGNIDADPLFVPAGEYGFCLSQVAAGQPADSPCVDAGGGQAAETCITLPDGDLCLDSRGTRTDEIGDTGLVDVGNHRPLVIPVIAGLACSPGSGTLPFTCGMQVTLVSGSGSLTRRVAGRIDVDMAGGGAIENWRAGWTNLSPWEVFFASWNQALPAVPSLTGENVFRLAAEDVTPAPFNQPPFPPAGGTDRASCTVTGFSPQSSANPSRHVPTSPEGER